MTNQSCLAGLNCLTAAQWSQRQQAVQVGSEGAEAVTASELRIDAEYGSSVPPLHCARSGRDSRTGLIAAIMARGILWGPTRT